MLWSTALVGAFLGDLGLLDAYPFALTTERWQMTFTVILQSTF